MGSNVKAVLFIVIILGIIIYLFRSGLVSKGISAVDNSIHSSSSSFTLFPSSSSTSSLPPAFTVATSSTPTSISVATTPTSTINPADIPAGFTAAELSPYFQEVRFSGVEPNNPYASYGSGSYGEIILGGELMQSSSPIDITGWQIKTNDGGEYIPQAVNIYDTSGLTLPGDILVSNGQYVYLYSSSGPFNLRLNECIGYIAAQQKFTPPLPENCPYVDRTGISNFTGECQNFISSIGSCEVPDLNNAPIPNDDYACRDYIEDNFNYRACFNAHVNDADFLSNQWWVWMGASPLDEYHDNVYLYDRKGLLVDKYSY